MKVKMKNSMWEKRHLYFFPIPEFNEYEGEEVQVKWLTPGQLALTTGDPGFPFRVLERKYIVSIDNSSYSYETAQASARTIRVRGSKGNEYVVTLGPNPHCTCTGFGFRRTCKHITEAQAI